MAGLADDWSENRQTCVDVLCAYLRMPYAPDPGEEAPEHERLAFSADREVRHTLLRVIAAHLQEGAAVPWCGLDLDFTGVVFDSGSFGGAVFSGGLVSFTGALFPGDASFARGKFSGGKVSFAGARFSGGNVNFQDAEFTGGQVALNRAKFTGGKVIFSLSRFLDSEVSFNGAEFSGSSEVFFVETEFAGGEVSFDIARFTPGSEVNFHGAKFSGARVHFYDAEFTGGNVDFAMVNEWSHPPEFDFGQPPDGVRLPEPPSRVF